jgi:hypothetical protein
MSKKTDAVLEAEKLVRDILPKTQKVDAETVRSVAEKVARVISAVVPEK